MLSVTNERNEDVLRLLFSYGEPLESSGLHLHCLLIKTR
jgi:hypothetical protein